MGLDAITDMYTRTANDTHSQDRRERMYALAQKYISHSRIQLNNDIFQCNWYLFVLRAPFRVQSTFDIIFMCMLAVCVNRRILRSRIGKLVVPKVVERHLASELISLRAQVLSNWTGNKEMIKHKIFPSD